MNTTDDLVEVANKAGSFKVFTKAIAAAGLAEALSKAGRPYTVFAPTDKAFAKLSPTKLENLLKPENRENLQLILRNHIVAGKMTSAELKRLASTRTIKGDELLIEGRAGLWINEAQVVSPDHEASNGILHGIDCLLMPRTKTASTNPE